jgi:hypothetical protein
MVYRRPFRVQPQFHGPSCWSFGWLHGLLRLHVCLLHKDSQLPNEIEDVYFNVCLLHKDSQLPDEIEDVYETNFCCTRLY